MEAMYSIGVVEALEQISFPSFFSRSERKAAYELIRVWGNAEERLQAERARDQYPFEEPKETLFPSLSENDFPIANNRLHA